jgi:hypothetical protein
MAGATALGLVIYLHSDHVYRQVLITTVVGLGLGTWALAYRLGAPVPLRILALLVGVDIGVLTFNFALAHPYRLGEVTLAFALIVASIGFAAFWQTRPVRSLFRRHD